VTDRLIYKNINCTQRIFLAGREGNGEDTVMANIIESAVVLQFSCQLEDLQQQNSTLVIRKAKDIYKERTTDIPKDMQWK